MEVLVHAAALKPLNSCLDKLSTVSCVHKKANCRQRWLSLAPKSAPVTCQQMSGGELEKTRAQKQVEDAEAEGNQRRSPSWGGTTSRPLRIAREGTWSTDEKMRSVRTLETFSEGSSRWARQSNPRVKEPVYPPRVLSLEIVVRNSRGGGVPDVESALDDLVDLKLNARDMSTVLARETDWEIALVLFNWMKAQEGYKPSTYHYNILVKLVGSRSWSKAEELVEEMISVGLEPDNITYNTLISKASRARRFDEALRWTMRMVDSGCVPDERTYTTMISTLGKAGRWSEAEALYTNMMAAGFKPNAIIISVMINFYGSSGRLKDAVSLFGKMETLGLKPTTEVYNSVLKVLSREGKTRVAEALFEKMKAEGVAPDVVTYTTMLWVFTDKGDAAAAVQMFQRLCETGLELDRTAYNAYLGMCSRFGLVKEAEEALEHMRASDVPPDVNTYVAVVNVYAESGNTDKAESAFGEMLRARVAPNLQAYTSLLKAHVHTGDISRVMKILTEMRRLGVGFDSWVLVTLLNCFSASSLQAPVSQTGKAVLSNLLEHMGPNPPCPLVISIVREDDLSRVGELTEALMAQTEERSRTALVNGLAATLNAVQEPGKAVLVLLHAFQRGPFAQLLGSDGWNAGSIHLGECSPTVAALALRLWLHNLESRLQQGAKLEGAADLRVFVGTSKRETAVRRRVMAFLESMEIQFEENEAGWLSCEVVSSKLKSGLERLQEEEARGFGSEAVSVWERIVWRNGVGVLENQKGIQVASDGDSVEKVRREGETSEGVMRRSEEDVGGRIVLDETTGKRMKQCRCGLIWPSRKQVCGSAERPGCSSDLPSVGMSSQRDRETNSLKQ